MVMDQPVLKISTFNCRSVKNSLIDIQNLCNSHDIILLQETWLMPNDVTFLNSIHSDFLSYGNSAMDTSKGFHVGRPFGGLAFLWRKALGNAVIVKNYDDHRLLGLLLSGPDFETLIINVYMPTADPENHGLFQDYLGILSSIVTESGCSHVIIPGDWNARKDREEFQWVSEFCTDSDLLMSDVNRLPDDTFTYVSDSHQTVSWIDHVIMSTNADRACVDMTVVYDLIISDHRPISFTMNLGDFPHVDDFKPPPSFNIHWDRLSRADIMAYAGKVEAELDDIIVPIDALLCSGCEHDNHRHNLCTYYEGINQALITSGKAFEVKTSPNYSVVAGWNDLVSDAHRVARADFLHWRCLGNPRQGPVFDAMRVSRARFKYALRACRANAEQLQADGLATALMGKDFRRFWKEVQRKKGPSSPVPLSIDGHSGTRNVGHFWKGHYESLLNSVSRPDHSNELTSKLGSLNRENISWTHREIHDFRNDLKLGKAVGMDGISSEHLKYASSKIDVHLALIFNSFICHSFLPASFMPVKIIPIVKNATGDISSSKNYRPVAIATVASKVFEMAILGKVDAIRDIPVDNQFGFSKGSSTDQCIFLLKERIRRYVQLEGMVYCCFLDASKAFDRVCHDTLFLQLIHYGIPTSVIRILRFWYSEQVMYISWNGFVSGGFSTRNGVRQGGILSPGLFNMYVNYISVKLNQLDIGCYLNTVSVNHLVYADDLCLISPSLAGLRKLVLVCEAAGDYLSIRFNAEKTVCMRFGPPKYRDIPFFPVTLLGSHLQFVDHVKYLGHTISSDLSDSADMEKAKRAIYARGNSLVRKFGACSENVKISLFGSYMTPIYCCHLWASYTVRQMDAVRTAYNCIFRKLFRISRYDSARVNYVQRSLPTLQEIVRKNTASILARLSSSANHISADVCHMTSYVTFIGQVYFSRVYVISRV